MRFIILFVIFTISNKSFAYTYLDGDVYANVFVKLSEYVEKKYKCKRGISEIIEYTIVKEQKGKRFNYIWSEEWTFVACSNQYKLNITFKQENKEHPSIKINN